MSDGKDINNDDPSSCIEEVDKLLEKVDDAAGIKSSSNDGLADNATPDDVLSLIDYWNILYKKKTLKLSNKEIIQKLYYLLIKKCVWYLDDYWKKLHISCIKQNRFFVGSYISNKKAALNVSWNYI